MACKMCGCSCGGKLEKEIPMAEDSLDDELEVKDSVLSELDGLFDDDIKSKLSKLADGKKLKSMKVDVVAEDEEEEDEDLY